MISEIKKWISDWLIIWWIIIFISWIWAWLTKLGVIPNWFYVDLLQPITWTSQFRKDWTHKDYRDFEKDTDLSEAMKSMNLRATWCPNIFCQKNDGYNDDRLEHYYRDKKNKDMILIPHVHHVGGSHCLYYDKLFLENKLTSAEETYG